MPGLRLSFLYEIVRLVDRDGQRDLAITAGDLVQEVSLFP